MSITIQKDRSGRLTPTSGSGESALTRKGGITVLGRVNAKVDTASAVAAEREAQGERGRRTGDPRIETLD
jgi:autotransporter adhesin